MDQSLPPEIRAVDDNQWLQMLNASIENPVIDGIEFPGFPSEALQTMFVGSANQATLGEAFNFYRFLKEQAALAGNPVAADSHFLDFGCGWGRYLRFFWKDINVENLYGCDVNPMIVDTCHAIKVPGSIATIEATGKLPYSDDFFDIVMAYSVFTHLPESVHLHWLREIARVTRAGSIFCLTLEPRRFIDFIDNIPADASSDWYRKLAVHKPNIPGYYQDFDAGKLVFMPTNEGIEDTYGDAVVPLSYIEKHWQPYFEVITYVDDSKQFWQAVLVVKRTGIPL